MYSQLPEIGWITARDIGQNETNGGQEEGSFTTVKPEQPVLVVHGSYFRNTTELACSVGGIITTATYISEWQESVIFHTPTPSPQNKLL